DAPLFVLNDRVEAIPGAAVVRRDTLFLPLALVTEVLPRILSERYRWDPAGARLIEATAAVAARAPAHPGEVKPADAASPSGLKAHHIVTIDPGHGGVDPGNPGEAFPHGVKEKHVTLQIGLLLRDELRRRGVGVRMTRTTDTLIALGDRGRFCTESCDLFVSLHVNSLKRRPGYRNVRGFETYFLAEAKTEDAARVARMENEAVRFETGGGVGEKASGIDFILKDLQLNEHLRESARAAELLQERLENVHSGPNLGVKQAGFMVLTTARRPAILVEMGYSTNPADARQMVEPEGQRALARAMADAIVAYLAEWERKTGAAAGTN
ncbi:MAG: N-acetylmuramoyl-L-alanine amidase family protein, partial [Gemmatimonadota bacterium]